MVVRRTMVLATVALVLGACGRADNHAASTVKTKTHAVPIADVKLASAKKVDPHLSERVFEFGDALEALGYQLSFTGDTRDAAQVTRACSAILGSHTRLVQDLSKVGGQAGDVAQRLVGAAASAVTACNQSPGAIDEATAEAAQQDFGVFRELALDFAGLTAAAT